MNGKQRRAIKTVEWFIPTNVDWDKVHEEGFVKFNTLNPVGLLDVIEDPEGLDADEAFLLKSVYGKKPKSCKNLSRFAQLMWGQRWMATTIKIWKESIDMGKNEGCLSYIFPEDFDDEPDYIKELFMKCWNNPELKRKDD